MATKDTTLTDLRSTCQAMGIKFSFGDDAPMLRQKISLKAAKAMPVQPIVIAAPEDQRLRSVRPAIMMDTEDLLKMLQPMIARGLKMEIVDDTFTMRYGLKSDTGTLRQPPRVIVDCARRVMT